MNQDAPHKCRECPKKRSDQKSPLVRGLCRVCYDRWLREHNQVYKQNQRTSSSQWRKNNPEKIASTQRKHALKRYGLTIEEYEEMVRKQNDRCAICEQPSFRDLDVDHDHSTNHVRGLLCVWCNRGLGHFKDNIEVMMKAIEYLKRSR